MLQHFQSRVAITRSVLRCLLGLLVILLLWPRVVGADTGPKPNQEYTFVFQTPQPIAIVGGQLLQCHVADCSDAKPLQRVGPQRFQCQPDHCSSVAYGYADYQQLVIDFADRTRRSHVFTQRGFNGSYEVTVRPDDLVVRERFSSGYFSPYQVLFFFPALLLTLVIETGIAAIYARVRKLRKLLRWVLLANILSLPMVWFVIPLLNLAPSTVVIVGETYTFVFEALLLYATNRRQLSLRSAALLSFVMNLPSFVVGFLVI